MRATIVILLFVRKRGMAAKRGIVLPHDVIEEHSFMIEWHSLSMQHIASVMPPRIDKIDLQALAG
jgi:hypothetical protein